VFLIGQTKLKPSNSTLSLADRPTIKQYRIVNEHCIRVEHRKLNDRTCLGLPTLIKVKDMFTVNSACNKQIENSSYLARETMLYEKGLFLFSSFLQLVL
jgi:hypothetical protein